MKQRIFVTGAAGFVGANLVHQLIDNGYDVHIAVRSGGSLWRLDDIISKITVHEDVLSDAAKTGRILKKLQPSGIFHLAAFGSYPTQTDVNLMISTNINGLYNLLTASRDIHYSSFVISGSSSEYGRKIQPMKESDHVEPNNMYAVTKVAATNMAVYFAKTFHKPVNVFRLFNVYGYYEEKGRLVRTVIESALKNTPVKLSTGREARDFIFAGDVADAFIRTLTKGKMPEGEIFNIGTGVQTTVHELVKNIIRLTGSKSKIMLNAYAGRPWDSFHWQADTQKTNRILGFKAETELTEGLKKTIKWYGNK